jgi:hypothetical protein
MSPSFDFAPISARAQASRRPHLFAQLISFIAIIFVVLNAHAAIKINGIDEGRASYVSGIGTTDITVFGGTAGTCSTGASATDTTCNSCLQNSTTGDGGLTPCNDRRVNGNLILRITFTSDSQATGYPAAVVTAATGGTTTRIDRVASSTAVAKGSPGTLEIKWSDLCGAMTAGTSGGNANNCVLTASDFALVSITVGMKSVNDTNGFASGDDQSSTAIKVKLVAPPVSGNLASTGGNGITYFEVTSGDRKGTVSKLSCTQGSGFPSSQSVRFRWVRVLFEQRTTEATPVWSKINPGSAHSDLQISDAGTCDAGTLNLSPVAFSGGTAVSSTGVASNVSIENADGSSSTKPIYDIKVASVDEARNVYLYTPASNDQDCEDANGNPNNPAARSADGIYECHTIRPAVVAGVLANKVNCFIATASYGSPMAGEVDTFRHFRDTYLIPTRLGLEFVRWYYNNGPVYAKFIAQSDTYRAIARGFLWLPLQFAKISLDYGIVAGLSFLFFVLLSPIALLAWMLKRRRSAGAQDTLNA